VTLTSLFLITIKDKEMRNKIDNAINQENSGTVGVGVGAEVELALYITEIELPFPFVT
jgi:hypothetical protein